MDTEHNRLGFHEWIHHVAVGVFMVMNTFGVRYMLIPLSSFEKRYFHGSAVFDYYQYFRSRLLFFVCIIILLNFLFGYVRRKYPIELNKGTLLLCSFMGVCAVSYVFSPYGETGDEGFVETYEGISTLVSYGILALITSMQPMTGKVLRYYAGVMAFCVSVTAVTAILQYFGNDPLDWSLVKAYASPAFTPTEPPENGYGTAGHGFLGNPNYFSSFFALFIPFAYFQFLGSVDRLHRTVWWSMVSFVNFSLMTSGTASSLLVIVSGMLLCWTRFKSLGKTVEWIWHFSFLTPLTYFIFFSENGTFKSESITAGICYVSLALVIWVIVKYQIKPRYVFSLSLIVIALIAVGLYSNFGIDNYKGLSHMEIHEGVLSFVVDGTTFAARWDSAKGRPVVRHQDRTTPEELSEYTFKAAEGMDEGYFVLSPFEITFIADEAGITFVNSSGGRDMIQQPVFWGPEGYGTWGSSRLYIWQHTLPVLSESLLLGTGPDTFGIVFPQNDVVSKIRYLGMPYGIVTKAHNLYLNYAVNLGIIGVAVYVALQAVCVEGLSRIQSSEVKKYSDPILIGVIIYGISGLVNDSRVFIAPYQWFLLGIGYALIRTCRTDVLRNDYR